MNHPDTERRDRLALDRTHLANERTLLAYVRTGLTMVAAGAGILQFIQTPVAALSGWVLIAAGLVTLPVGLWRFLHLRRRLRTSHPAAT
ncbi:MAG: DUF202 domain-containing protein, partial [Gemmatimonadota bacterium]